MNTQEKNVLCNNNKKKSCLKETLIGFRAARMLKKKWHWQVQSAAR